MESKPVLEWEEVDDVCWTGDHFCAWAETAIGTYAVIDSHKGEPCCKAMLEEADFEYEKWSEQVPDIAAAKSACEADYISRCTERLELVRPGDVQIPAEMFGKLADSWCGACREEGLGDCRECQVQQLRDGLPVAPVGYLAEGEVAVKRETAEWLYGRLKTEPVDNETDMTDPSNIAFECLKRALEGKHE